MDKSKQESMHADRKIDYSTNTLDLQETEHKHMNKGYHVNNVLSNACGS
jgi:hypothetical protein